MAGHIAGRGHREAVTAYLFLLPFLVVYLAFLVYPFFNGIWISLHDWNLLEVAINPASRKFVGLQNYVRLFWGRDMEWSPFVRPVLQTLSLAAAALAAWCWRRGRVGTQAAFAVAAVALALWFAFGWAPGEEGRWYNRRFWPVVANTVLFVVLTVPAITALSLVLAAALNRQTRAMAVFRTLFFLSQVLSVTVVTLIWQIMFSPTQGMIANLTETLGGTPVAWLTEPGYAMAAMVVATLWWSVGIAMVLFLAGLQEISGEIYEAARLDNASPLQTFFYITVPNMTRTISLVVVLQIILHFQVFGQSHLMTNGGPNDRTQVLVRFIYQTAFRDSDLGEASAMAVFLFVIMAVFSAIHFTVRERNA